MNRNVIRFLLVLAACLMWQMGLQSQEAPPTGVPDRAAENDQVSEQESPVAKVEKKKKKKKSSSSSSSINEGKNEADGGENRGDQLGEIVQFMQPVVIATNQTAKTVVVIGSDVTVDGRILEDLVVVGGTARVNGQVDGDVVAPMGRVIMGPDAEIGGDTVAIGGGLVRPATAVIRGTPVAQIFPGFAELLEGFPTWVTVSAKELLWKARPLSFQVGWVWTVLGILLVAHAFVHFVFPRAVRTGVTALCDRPATTFFSGILAVPAVLFLVLILSFTVILPLFFLAAVPLLLVFGKVIVEEQIGGSVLRRLGLGSMSETTAAWVLGTVLVVSLYLVPFVGIAAWLLLSVWALGAALMALTTIYRGERPVSLPPMAKAASPLPGRAVDAAKASQGFVDPEVSTGGLPESVAESVEMPNAALSLPLASNGMRFMAGAIDVMAVALLTGWLGPIVILAWVGYFAAMWVWRGTTLGGVILGLQVVRLDGGVLDFPVGLVRALGWLLGAIPCYLGWLWALWHPQKQAWHDKLAGTVVVRNPNVSLLK